ncbi:acyl-CoA dehydrogenase family protein [Nocardia vaccinii]|uniref:acyl-CoA dehydrogenase family protein n=1 Tax=Nocardia vaccinii TaxID=1822 RepID=UPI000836C28C|nr:acyl-CoA dehydrogenase family protein [Nocardia vaccinii]
MKLVFDDEHDQLRDSVRGFLAAKSPESEVRRLMATSDGYDPAFWSQLTKDLELTSLIVPERFGGAGAGQRELTVVFEEFGRALACAPLFSTVAMAANALLASQDEQAQQRYLPGISDGSTTATLAHLEADGHWGPDTVTLTATERDGRWSLTGSKVWVVDGATANLVLVTARISAGIGLFAVTAPTAGLSAEPAELVDHTRKYAHLQFHDVTAELVGESDDSWPDIQRALDLAAISLAAEQLGGAQRLLEMSTEYAILRSQFGRAIGSFQSIKHACADLLLAVEGARSAVYEATWAADEDSADLRVAASLAQAVTSEVYYHAAKTNIQIHGGIGFTWEHPAHLYYRRAKCSELYLGDPAHHRTVIAEQLGL